MNEGIKKFRELLLTDEEFQQKVKAAAASYTGEQTEEAVFNNVLLPVGQEYGVTTTFEEFKAYIDQISDQEINNEELSQIAGGSKGVGLNLCLYVGLGPGWSEDEDSIKSMCYGIGLGTAQQICAVEGVGND